MEHFVPFKFAARFPLQYSPEKKFGAARGVSEGLTLAGEGECSCSCSSASLAYMLHHGEPRGEPDSSVTWLAEPRSSNIAFIGHIEGPSVVSPIETHRATGQCLEVSSMRIGRFPIGTLLTHGFRKHHRQCNGLMGRLTYSWAASTRIVYRCLCDSLLDRIEISAATNLQKHRLEHG